jgi:hypothetical protein
MMAAVQPHRTYHSMPTAFYRFGNLVLALVAGSLVGCAADSPMVEALLFEPGYFDNFDCPQIVARFYSASQQVAKLTAVMDRANTDPTGPLVNAIAYNTDYAKALLTQKHADQAAQLKGCDLTKEPESTARDANADNVDLLGRPTRSTPPN